MKYALRLDDKSMPHMIERAKRAEAAGFEALFAGELAGTPYVNCAAVAGHTTTIKLGTGVAYAFVRSPMTTALTALDLDRLTDGRFILGLSTSLPRLIENWHNMPYGKPIPHIKEYLQVTRLIMENAHKMRPIQFNGEYYKTNIVGYMRPWRPVREKMPILLGAVGPGMIKTAGEVADGLIAHPVYTLKYIKEVMQPKLAEGMAKGGKERKDFFVWLYVDVLIGNDKKTLLEIARGTPAFYATVRSYEPFFALHGFQQQAQQIQQIFRENKGFSPKMNAAVTDEMAETFVAMGTADEVRRKIAEYGQYADGIILQTPTQAMKRADALPYENALFDVFGK
ncbi:MAG: LLM class flavin-dependent oxidoreductase [Chloroflexi bacterium]|nr:LLM class flavin-dependent oxidoreductase [Chloroflexota bacterium]